METVTVTESLQGKFGPQVKTDKGFLSFGKFFKGETQLTPGVYQMDIFRTQKGNGYINSLEMVNEEAPKKVSKKKTNGQVETRSVETTEVNKPRNYDKENRGKVKSNLLNSLSANPNVVTCVEDLAKLVSPEVQALLDKLVETVF